MKHHHRFNIAVILTIIAIAWVVVPALVGFVETVAHYNPRDYEPKDIERGQWVARRGALSADFTLETILKVILFLFVGLAWLLLAPTFQRPSRSRR